MKTLSFPHKSTLRKVSGLLFVCILLVNFSLLAATIEPASGSPGLTLKWRKTLGTNALTEVGPLAADLFGDGRVEIVVTGGGSLGALNGTVTALNGTTGNVIWQVQPGGVGSKTPFDIADIDGDGKPEIIIYGMYPVVLRNNGSTYWARPDVSSFNLWSSVFDIDGDGRDEIFLSSGKGPFQGYDYFTELSYDGKILAQNPTSWHPCWGGTSIGDPNSNGSFILYQGDRKWGYRSSPSPEEPYINGGWGLRALDAATLTPLWNDSSITCSSHPPILADVDKDGILDVIATDQSGQGLLVANASNGVVSTAGGKYRKSSSLGLPSHSEPTVADIDGDGNLEIITCRDTNPRIWDLYAWKLDGVLPIVCSEPPRVGDVNGDGNLEIIAVSNGSIYIYDRNYTQVDIITGLNGPRTFTLLQDVDGDNKLELIVSSSWGYVYCYGTPTSAPTPKARSNLQFYSEYKQGVPEYVSPPGPQAPLITAQAPTDGTTNVPVSLTQLSFNLTDYQHGLINYTVTTFPDIGSGAGINKSNGRYSSSISNLNYATTYTWTVTATDGQNSRSKTYAFTTQSLPPWWNTTWQYRKTITIDPTKVNGNQTDFPVLVDLTDGNFTNEAQTNGYDFVFTDANQVKLSHEIEQYDPSTGHLTVWVKVPFLSSSANTLLYLYYGNPTCGNQQDKNAVWDSSNRMVLHLNEKTGTHYDSTVNANNGTPNNGVTQGVAGKIDGSDAFDGINDYVQVAHSDTLSGYTEALTASFWLRLDDVSRRQTILNKYNSGTGQRSWYIEYQTNLLGFFTSQDGTTYKEWHASFTPTAGTWYYVTIVWQNSTVPKFYLNGVQLTTTGASTITSIYNNVGVPLMIGRCQYDATRYLKGALDEIRISNPARSAGWILTCYNNQRDPSTFYQVGTEEALTAAPFVTDPNPINGATKVTLDLAALSFNLTDYQNDPITYAVTTTPDIGSLSQPNVPNGRYSVPVSGFNGSTTYTWIVNMTDGSHSSSAVFTFTTEPSGNKPPTQGTPLLVSSDGTNMTSANLICYNQTTADRDNDPVTNTYNWIRNDVSINSLLMSFNTNTSSTVTDYSGNGNNGTVTGATWQKSGIIGGAYSFDGVSNYISIPHSASLDGGGSWNKLTVEFWINLGSASQNGKRVIAKRGSTSGTYSYQVGFQTANGRLYFDVWNPSVYEVEYTTVLAMSTWYHIVCTYNSGQGSKIYINGTDINAVKVGSGSVSGNVAASSGQPLFFGCRYGTQDFFKGTLDEVRIIGARALTPEQIIQDYTQSKDGLSAQSTLVSKELLTGEVWACQVTPNDGNQDGAQKTSNPITILAAPQPYDDVIFDSSFDMGNLRNVLFQSGDASGNRFYTGEQNHTTVSYSDKHWWFYFSMDNVSGKTVTVKFVNNEAIDFTTDPVNGNRWPNIEPVFSYDNINWMRVPLTGISYDRTAATYTMTITLPSNQSKVWLAPLPPYTIHKRDALFDEFNSSPYLVVTSLGTTPGGQELKVATITDPAYSDAGKFKSYVTGQQHAGELGSWNIEGLIRYLLSDDPTAAVIRRNYIFRIVPIVNVDGVYQGVSRYTPLRNGVQYDLNREWTKDVSSMQPEIRWIWQDLLVFKPNSFNDMHSTINTEVTSPKEALTYTWSTSDPTIIAFRAKIKLGGYPETVTGTTSYACTVVHNSAALGNIKESVSWEDPCSELSTNPGVKLTVNDWMTWGAGWAKGNYLYFGNATGTLTVNTVGSGSVIKTPDNTSYDYGTSVQLTANPGQDSIFSRWTGDFAGTVNPASITITGNLSVTAIFTKLYTLTVNIQGYGNVTRSPDQPTYEEGTIVQITATPEPGYTFSYWSGDLSSSSNPEFVNMTANKIITAVFALMQANWWNTSWQYRRTITIDHTKVSSDQTDFPILIDLTDSGLTTKTQSNGNDFVFTDATQVKLSHEIESYSSGTGHLVVWVRIPVLSSTIDTVLHMYYGNPTCGNQQAKTAVWDTSNRMILHLAETTGTQYDSTINGNNATPNNGVIQGTAGKIDGSDTFDGINDYLQTLHSDTLTGFSQGFTASFWLRLDDVSRRQTILNKYNSGTGQRSWYIEYQTNLLGFFASQDGTAYSQWQASFTPTAGTWYFITVTWEPNAVPKFYVSGTQVTTLGTAKIASIYNNAGVPLYIGRCQYDATRYLKGSLDEIRISNPARNASWILTCYNNQRDPSTFYQIGTEEPLEPPRYTLTVNVVGQGTISKAPDQVTYANNTSVQLTPTAAPGWTFTGWSGDLSGSVSPTTIIMIGNKNVTATFTQDQYTLVVGVVGSGSVTKNPDKTTYTYGEVVTLTASANVGYVFTGWSGDLTGNTNPNTITMNGGRTVNATFSRNEYTLTVTVSPVGSGSVSLNSSGPYYYGSAVQLTPSANLGWVFSHWTGNLMGSDNPATITIAGNTSITAHFSQNEYALTTTTIGNGSIIRVPDQATYTYNAVVQLTAVADPGWAFAGWSGDVTSTENSIIITIDSSKSVIATFTQNHYTLTTAASPEGRGVIDLNNSGPYYYGDVVGLEAVPSTGWSFSNWDGDLSGGVNPTTITINDNKSVTAVFAQNQYTLTITTDGSGSVSLNASGPYTYGSVVELTATANTGWKFSGWSGDLSGNVDPATIIMTSNRTVNAAFVLNQAPNITGYTPTVDYPCTNQGNQTTFNVTATDPDGDIPSYEWYLDGTLASTTASYIFNAVSGTSGAHNVTVLVKDGYGGEAKRVWFLTVDANLVMPFDTSATPITDYSGLGNNGTLVGPTWTANGKIGGAYSFDGVNDYISIPDSVSLDGNGAWDQITIEFWLKITANQRGSKILRKGFGGSTGGPYSYQVGFQTSTSLPNNTLYFDVWNPNMYEVQINTTTTSLSLNTWYHIVCVYKSGVGSKIYINSTDVLAVKVATNPVGSETGLINASRGHALFIGAKNGTAAPWTPVNFFTGMLDEFRIYPIALTPQQVNRTYYQTKASFTSLPLSALPIIGLTTTQMLILVTSPLTLCALILLGKKRKRGLLKLSFPFSLV